MRRRRFFRLFALLAAPPWAAAQGEAPPAPQLARSYRGGLHLPDWLVSEKYDGVRAWWDGQALYPVFTHGPPPARARLVHRRLAAHGAGRRAVGGPWRFRAGAVRRRTPAAR